MTRVQWVIVALVALSMAACGLSVTTTGGTMFTMSGIRTIKSQSCVIMPDTGVMFCNSHEHLPMSEALKETIQDLPFSSFFMLIDDDRGICYFHEEIRH